MREFIETGDHRLMRRLNHWRAPKWIRLWMIAATRGGDGWLWYLLGLALAVFGDEDRFHAVGAAGLGAGAGIAAFISLKRVASRRRPCQIEPHCWAKLLPPDRFSFPSGHTITAFTIALSIGAYYRSMSPVLLFCAASIGLSRIVLGMHFLSDVVAGALIGAALGQTAVIVVGR